jgi:GNAT superfamily N-acetyltransferase
MQPQIQTLTADELYERTRTESANRDLFAVNKIGGREVKRLHYLCVEEYRHEEHIVLSLGQRIVGIGGVQVNPYDTKMLWIKHISVEDVHQGKRYSRLIMEAIYAYAIERGLIVSHGSFSPMGQRLKHIATELNERFPQAASSAPFTDWHC